MCGGMAVTQRRATRSARVALRRTLKLALHAAPRRVAAVYTIRRRRVSLAARSIDGGSYRLPVAQCLESLKVAPALRLQTHCSARAARLATENGGALKHLGGGGGCWFKRSNSRC
jgi:hypothetical protein